MTAKRCALIGGLDGWRGRLVDLCSRLVARDSRNPPGDTRAAAGLVAAYLGDVPGVEVRLVAADPTRVNVVARLAGGRRRLVCSTATWTRGRYPSRRAGASRRLAGSCGTGGSTMAALGGLGSPAGSCVWHVVGLQRSLREWALRQGWGGRPVRQEQAQGILVAALGILVGHFGHRAPRDATAVR